MPAIPHHLVPFLRAVTACLLPSDKRRHDAGAIFNMIETAAGLIDRRKGTIRHT
jgi:hypothetical protein